MTVSPSTTIAIEAPTFRVQYKYFVCGSPMTGSAVLFQISNFVADQLPAGWTATGDTITAGGGWRDITSNIKSNATYQQTWEDNTIKWNANVYGFNYSASDFGEGNALACLKREHYYNTTTACYTSGSWNLFYLGEITDINWSHEYRGRKEWSANVVSLDYTLSDYDSPILDFGEINVAADASVTAKSTLAIPAAEAGKGEFVGVPYSVGPENVVDGRLATVWISHDQPTALIQELPYSIGFPSTAEFLIDEVLFKPLAGWNQETTWWIEVLRTVTEGDTQDFLDHDWVDGVIVARNADGDDSCIEFKKWRYEDDKDNYGSQAYGLSPCGRAIICGDKMLFDSYTGGYSDYEFILDARTYGGVGWNATDNITAGGGAVRTQQVPFNLHPTDGYVAIGTMPPISNLISNKHWDVIKWGPTTSLPGNIAASGTWSGSGVTVTTLPAGYTYRRSSTGVDTNARTDWVQEQYPKPGYKYSASSFQWIKIELKEHTSTLDQDFWSASNTELVIGEGTTGWPSSGSGIIEGDEFTWTGRTGSSLTGVTAACDHAIGAIAYPLSASEAQTGWLCNQLTVKRIENVEKISSMRVYTSKYSNTATPPDTDEAENLWEYDYYSNYATYKSSGVVSGSVPKGAASTGKSVIDINLRDASNNSQWIRSILIIIDRMANGGRAKINEVSVKLDQLSINTSDSYSLQNSSAYEIIKYILNNYTWYTYDFNVINYTGANWGVVGNLSTAAQSVVSVINDIAKSTGIVVEYSRDAKVKVRRDPWWPSGLWSTYPEITMDKGYVRGEVSVNNQHTNVTGVALTAQNGDGQLYKRIVVPPGAIGSGVVEISDVTVSSEAYIVPLAWNLYYKEKTKMTASLTAKGIATELKCGDRITLRWTEGATTYEYGTWLITSMTVDYDHGSWSTVLDIRQFALG